MTVGTGIFYPLTVMRPAVIIHLVAAFLPQHDRHRLTASRTEHPVTEQCLYTFTLLAPALSSLPEIIIGPQPLFFGDKAWNIKNHLLTVRFWAHQSSLYTQCQIAQGFLRIGDTAIGIIFSLSRVTPATGYLDYSFRRPGCPVGWPNPEFIQLISNPVGSAAFISKPDKNLYRYLGRATVNRLSIWSQFVYLPPGTQHSSSPRSSFNNLLGAVAISVGCSVCRRLACQNMGNIFGQGVIAVTLDPQGICLGLD